MSLACGWRWPTGALLINRNMPEPIVRDNLAASRLRRLDIPDSSGGFYSLEAIYRTDTPPGPAAAALANRRNRLWPQRERALRSAGT